MEIKYSKKVPAIYVQCKKKFNVGWDLGVVITYGDTVYSKFGDTLTPDLKIHEETHVHQQAKIGTDTWWKQYLEDKNFRLSQELEAYKNQMEYARKNYKKDHIEWLFDRITTDMQRMYGGMITKTKAIELLT